MAAKPSSFPNKTGLGTSHGVDAGRPPAPFDLLLQPHADPLGHPARWGVLRVYESHEPPAAQLPKAPVPAGARGFCGQPAAPKLPHEQVADLHFPPALHLLRHEPALAAELARRLEHARPQPEAVLLVASGDPTYPSLCLLPGLGRGVVAHRLGVGEDEHEVVYVLGDQLAQHHPLRLQDGAGRRSFGFHLGRAPFRRPSARPSVAHQPAANLPTTPLARWPPSRGTAPPAGTAVSEVFGARTRPA